MVEIVEMCKQVSSVKLRAYAMVFSTDPCKIIDSPPMSMPGALSKLIGPHSRVKSRNGVDTVAHAFADLFSVAETEHPISLQ